MSSYTGDTGRGDKAKAIVAVIAVHAALAAFVLTSKQPLPTAIDTVRTVLIDIAEPPPPPPPPPTETDRADEADGAAAKKAEPSPVVAPKPVIVVPAPAPVVAAPVAGTGSASNAGSADAGAGTGAGGTGSGRGGGGSGGGIGENARLISGGLGRRDYRRLRSFAAPSGRAVLAILIGPDGRVAQCSTRQSSGDPSLDSELCAILAPRMVWSPARDRSGRPLTVGIYYTAIWRQD